MKYSSYSTNFQILNELILEYLYTQRRILFQKPPICVPCHLACCKCVEVCLEVGPSTFDFFLSLGWCLSPRAALSLPKHPTKHYCFLYVMELLIYLCFISLTRLYVLRTGPEFFLRAYVVIENWCFLRIFG